MVKMSILDLIPVREGQTTGQALSASIGLAKAADQCGFTRYWVAEHHNAAAVASTNPAVLIALFASRTENLRIGSGGVMLPNHAPLAVAEQFALLEAAFPGRIDLGIGRAPGTDPVTSWALRSGRGDETLREFPSWVEQVIALLDDGGLGVQVGGQTFELHATPQAASAPPVWLLGSSDYSARLAAQMGLPYVFAHHFSGQGTGAALGLYRDSFAGPGEPTTFLTVNVSVGHSMDEARELALPYQVSMARLRSGQSMTPLLSVEQASATEPPLSGPVWDQLVEPWLIGDPDQVADQIRTLASRFDVDEVMIHPIAGARETDPLDQVPAREFAVRELGERLAG